MAKRLAVRAIRLYGRALPSNTSPLEPNDSPDLRILIQSMGGIGNTLMATPLIAETRRLFPNARIDLLTSPGAAQLLAANPHVSAILTDPPANGTGTLKLVTAIRAARYDASLASLNSHLPKFATRVVFGRIPRRLMHAYEFRPYDDFSPAYTQVIPRPKERHDVECNLDLLASLTGAACRPGPLVLELPKDATDRARARLSNLGWRQGAPSVAICNGSSGWMSFKRWPLDHAMRLAEKLAAAIPNVQLFTFCGPEEADDSSQWKARFPDGRIHVVDGLDLPQFAAALGLMRLVVANDSLPMHIAAALQTPVVALFGPTDPARTGPWHASAHVIKTNVDYAPFYQLPYTLDPAQFPDCMETIDPDAVLEACTRLLDKSAPRP